MSDLTDIHDSMSDGIAREAVCILTNISQKSSRNWPVSPGGFEAQKMEVARRIAELEDLLAKYKWLAEHDIRLVPKDDWHTPGEPDQLGGFAVERRLGFVLTRLSRRYAENEAKS